MKNGNINNIGQYVKCLQCSTNGIKNAILISFNSYNSSKRSVSFFSAFSDEENEA